EVWPRPPYPIESGVFGKPTVVDNVETLNNIPWIMEHGAAAFTAMGTAESKGTKALCFNKGFAKPGIVEIEFGMSLGDAIFKLGGGGAGGVELAMALQHRLAGRGRVSLVTGGPPPLASYKPTVQARARRALKRCGVTLFEDSCEEIADGHVVLGRHGGRLACDAPVVAIGNTAPPWLRESGLALDEQGFIATGPTLQSSSHPEVFAAGDVATRLDAPRPRSGVFAVRAGPPLALNLRRFVAGGELQPYRPQRRSLNLLSCGGRHAIASWGGWSAEGGWVWWWKDRIDRAFIREFRLPPG
ncbi:partial NADP-reducing hydrogenase subunit HndC, partial [Burkholderiaceae bacterium]